MNRFGFKWCWVTTRCKVYAACAAVFKALDEGLRGEAIRRRVLELYEAGIDMFEVAPFRCIICGARATPNRERDDHRRRLTLDHIIPRSSSRAPRPGLRNLIAICSPCNSSRGARPLRIWLQNKHRAGELVEAPDVVLHRIAIVRSMPVSRGVAAAMTSYFYPGFARAQRGRWSRRKAARGAVADLPF